MGIFSDFNPFDPGNVFGGDKGDIVNNALDPFGGFLENAGINPWGMNELHEDAGDWMDDLADGNSAMAQNRWKNWKDGDGLQRSMLSGDLYASGSPWGTKLNNEVFGRDDKPIWTTLGGKTQGDYQYAADQGNDMSANAGVDMAGSTIGKGFLNAFTFGAGGAATDALDAYGYGDNSGGDKILKNGLKNYATNYLIGTGMDAAGAQMSGLGGYSEQGGGYVGNNEYGGVGNTVNVAGSLGASPEYQAPINATLQAGATGGIRAAANGENIGRGVGKGLSQTGMKEGLGMGLDYVMNYGSDEMPDEGTLGGNMRDREGELDPQLQADVNAQTRMAALGQGAGLPMSFPGGPTEQPAAASNPFAGLGTTLTTPQGVWPGFTPQNAGNWGQVGTGLYGLYKARQLSKLGGLTGSQNAARGQLEALMRDPSAIQSMPGYKAGEQAVTRNMASQGYLGSGNMMAALKDYGGGFYNDTLRTMSALGAATPDQLQYNMGGLQLTGNSLQSLLYGGMGLMNPKKPGER